MLFNFTGFVAAPTAAAGDPTGVPCNTHLSSIFAPLVNDLGGAVIGLKVYAPVLVIILLVALVFLIRTRHGSGLITHVLQVLCILVVLGFAWGLVNYLGSGGPNC
jgi:hypothetical protein